MKHKNSEMKFKLYEKSFHKSNFLKEVSNKFNLNVEVLQKDIFEEKNLSSDIIVARAFKPLPVILDLVHSNFKFLKKLFCSWEKWKNTFARSSKGMEIRI